MRKVVSTYGVALAAVLAALLLRWLLDPILGDTLPLVTLFGAVALAVWFGGYRPALLVVVVGYVACAYLFIEPRGALGLEVNRNQVGLLAFLVTCAIIIGFGEATRISRRRIAEADRRKDEFLAMLAHELRGPLAPLSNMLEVMKRADGDIALIQQARTTMERQLRHLVRLVDDLIDVSRITRNNVELRKERVELASIIQQSAESCRPLAERAKIELTTALPPQPIYLNADPMRLVQVFSNILNNACKYTEVGGQIRVSAQRQGSDAIARVEDTGIGIPPAQLASVFEMFTQIEKDRSQGGLGIGLALAKRLVEMHDGTVEAHSEGLGKGSAFVVRLPIATESPEDEPLVKDGRRRPDAPAVTAPPRRILVVDDNVDSATSLARLLKMSGNETQMAHDGLDAVEAAERFRPDVILLDIGLPKLDGHDACRRIREHAWGAPMLIVALTGWGQEEDRRKSRDAGFDHHLVKPVDLAALKRLLASGKSNDRPPADAQPLQPRQSGAASNR